MNTTTEVRRLQYRQWSKNDIRWTLCQCVIYMTACFTAAFTQFHSIRRHRPATCITDVTSGLVQTVFILIPPVVWYYTE